MIPLPLININIKANIYGFEEDGSLLYEYKPLQNLKILNLDNSIELSDLRLNAKIANIDINKPINLETEVSYDDSINLLVNDQSNPLKIVNSRFYLTDSSHYKIADRKGNIDTNIYTEEDFKIEASLVKSVRSIINLTFEGIDNGGKLPVGSYHFYFKLADADGNETDFISESGKVVCHIGAINDPKSIRGGQLDENSDKLVKFKLNNLDLAYDYIIIYYTRTTGDGVTEITKSYKITDKFKINSLNKNNISITGYENYEEIDNSEINVQYTNFESAQTVSNCQNITFAGNIEKNYEVFKTLEKYSLFITPQLSYTETIGNLSGTYDERYNEGGFEYYNTKNIYYKLGYWNEEIYRFGIVYILNDYTLSPVFNIRGIKELTDTTQFYNYELDDFINFGEDFVLEKSVSLPENAKGVFKIKSNYKVFEGKQPIKPIGIKFNFNSYVITGGENSWQPGLQDLTKGFFIVRQKRVPTLLAQGLTIATSKKAFVPILKKNTSYFSESFLKEENSKPKIGRSIFDIPNTTDNYIENALLCPEASLRPYIFNNYFNSSEFVLRSAAQSSNLYFSQIKGNELYFLGYLTSKEPDNDNILLKSSLLLVEPGIDLINNLDHKFCSRAGNAMEAWKHVDPINGDLNDFRTDNSVTDKDWSEDISKIRGDFNSYIGSSVDNLTFGKYYNIFQKDYDFNNWKNYFRVRYNDSSPFSPISDRFSWNDLNIIENGLTKEKVETSTCYRGDCYINTYTHRMLSNFIDPELPTNNFIIDPWTWYKNYRVKTTTIKTNGEAITDNTNSPTGSNEFNYKKVLDLFTYQSNGFLEDIETNDDTISDYKIILPDGKKFKKYSEVNGIFGASKINRPDINAVPIGHWVSFKICSNINLAMRDIDFSRPEEESIHKMKRGFYPLQAASSTNKLPESNVINVGISKTLGDKFYFELPDVPFIKTNFSNRIHYSEVLQESSFKNGNRVFKLINYQDYTREYGALVKLVEWYGTLIAVMEHGVLMIPVNERAMMTNAQGENVYINTENVLPKNPKVLSNTFGSVWSDSIVKTPHFIYGIDTIGKKIWRTNGDKFDIISDLKIQKFLNDNIILKVVDRDKTPGISSIKSHYNAFKYDVMFVFVYGEKKWNLCWNEMLSKWTTQYSWFPEFSENINNIFYTFANNNVHSNKGNILYKHGFAGGIEESGVIEPTKWYDTQYPFEFEFIVNTPQGYQKIFDNLKIISNLAKPNSFYYEVVGEGYDWSKQKDLIFTLNVGATTSNQLQTNYTNYLTANPSVKKIPFIFIRDLNENWASGNKDLTIEQNNKTKEKVISSYQKGLDIKDASNRRLRGNMQYVEDFWDIQIQPISFKYAYLKDGVFTLSKNEEMDIRDKYIKIRVKYDGTQYAIINALRTFYTISFS